MDNIFYIFIQQALLVMRWHISNAWQFCKILKGFYVIAISHKWCILANLFRKQGPLKLHFLTRLSLKWDILIQSNKYVDPLMIDIRGYMAEKLKNCAKGGDRRGGARMDKCNIMGWHINVLSQFQIFHAHDAFDYTPIFKEFQSKYA